jgi:hypothetical protein
MHLVYATQQLQVPIVEPPTACLPLNVTPHIFNLLMYTPPNPYVLTLINLGLHLQFAHAVEPTLNNMWKITFEAAEALDW